MPFEVVSRVGPMMIFWWGGNPQREGANFEGGRNRTAQCREGECGTAVCPICRRPTGGWMTGLVCSGHCTDRTRSVRVHSLPWGVATRLFSNYFGISRWLLILLIASSLNFETQFVHFCYMLIMCCCFDAEKRSFLNKKRKSEVKILQMQLSGGNMPSLVQ